MIQNKIVVKISFITCVFCFHVVMCFSQNQSEGFESAFQNIEKEQIVTTDDFLSKPMNLNVADESDLHLLGILSRLQILSFLKYRTEHGFFLALEELQSIPLWDVHLIRKLQPYVVVNSIEKISAIHGRNTRGASQYFLSTFSNKFSSTQELPTNFMGAAYRLTCRYQLVKNKYLQFGFIGDKDAGEPFFKKGSKAGFDFYTSYIFIKKYRKLDFLVLGDFEIQMGQGLILWQSMAFKKSADVINIERQSSWIKPHKSTDEYNFSRGLGFQFSLGKWQLSSFVSYRALAATLSIDSVNGTIQFQSINSAGYHRSLAEIIAKNSLQQFSYGGSICYKTHWGVIGLNQVYYHFSSYFKKRALPYNFFAIEGKSWLNQSISYSLNRKNFHFFGEVAIDKNLQFAFLSSVITSVGSKVDLPILYRGISKKYQALAGNTFTESTAVTNENGLYVGIVLKPTAKLKLDFYCDFYQFPWLRYLKNSPMNGVDLLFHLSYILNKKQEFLLKYRREIKTLDYFLSAKGFVMNSALQSFRLQYKAQLNEKFRILQRFELVNSSVLSANSALGFLFFTEFGFQPLKHSLSFNLRAEAYDIDSYESRVYAYEPEPAYNFSLPAKMGQGLRILLNFSTHLTPKIRAWVKIGNRFMIYNTLKNSYKIPYTDSQAELKCQLLVEF